MRFQWRPNSKSRGLPNKIPNSIQMPTVPIGFSYRQLIPAYVERYTLPAIRGLDFDQLDLAVGLKALDIKTCAISYFFRSPADFFR